MDAGADVAGREVPAEAQVAGLTGGAQRFDAAGPARQPRVEDDSVADRESARKLLKLIETLEDNDDVQNVYANFDVSDEVMAEATA